MSAHGPHPSPRWLLPVAVAALIAGPVALYAVLHLAGVPAALASGVVMVIALKHVGLLAVLLAPLYALRRRLPRR